MAVVNDIVDRIATDMFAGAPVPDSVWSALKNAQDFVDKVKGGALGVGTIASIAALSLPQPKAEPAPATPPPPPAPKAKA